MPHPHRRVRTPQPRRLPHQAPHSSLTTPKLSVPPGIMAPSATRRPAQFPTRPKHPNTRLQEEQYETSVPTVADRIAQTVAALTLEPRTESIFHDDSYGYRPGRSPLMAVAKCRQRCWKRAWVIDLDVAKFFDSVDHEL